VFQSFIIHHLSFITKIRLIQKTIKIMPRSVNHVASRERRKKILKLAKGYYGRRKNVWTVAKNAVEKGLVYAYTGRKQKKRHFRSLWIVRINAGVRQFGLSYSVFMDKLHKSGIELNRKVLADLAMHHPDAFKAIVEKVK
jgi:large subunit ribosomal protein L20